MFKKGFTLAEVLITLGIIGVISALTLPSLLQDSNTAQIGPKLAKASSMFMQANNSLMLDNNLDSYIINDKLIYDSASAYVEDLINHLKATISGSHSVTAEKLDKMDDYNATNKACFTTNDGIYFCVILKHPHPYYSAAAPVHTQIIGTVYVDINGPTKPNIAATDVFAFALAADGTLRPVGGTNWNGEDDVVTHWSKNCNSPGSKSLACTGSVFENDFKVTW